MLSDAEKQLLLRFARRSLETALLGALPGNPEPATQSLCEMHGVFVTLRVSHELRGCIGYIDPVQSLVETVCEVVQKAAFDDTRFHPIAAEELHELEIEISVLSPMVQMQNIDQIEIGKHGLVVQMGNSRGLLLPQVAIEHGWNRETFLNQTARKAGLPLDAWRLPDVAVYLFSAEVFREHSSTVHHRET